MFRIIYPSLGNQPTPDYDVNALVDEINDISPGNVKEIQKPNRIPDKENSTLRVVETRSSPTF